MRHDNPLEFEELYQKGGWDGKGSGPGSTEAFTRGFREVFQNLLAEKQIKSVFDLGCGDWQWQQHMDWEGVGYEGWDISKTASESVISKKWPKSRCVVRNADAFLQPVWPEADLLLVKDVVHHISPYRVRMLIERSKLYNYVLWVCDLNDIGLPINMPIGEYGIPPGRLIYNFDRSVENYGYGPKGAFLQTNP